MNSVCGFVCVKISDDEDIIKECKYRTAILFGPPGTGKTTYGRALATKLGLDYLELTPGDFFAGGENSILATINDIFEHLLHLKNSVVFIDEIDDLVKSRDQNNENQPYDRRSLFVNSLLPRFQELHDNENIILLMATNNIERVDESISRMGRVDLVIPVGAMSPHGRLKFLYKLYIRHQEIFSKLGFSSDELIDLQMEYLNATEAFNFSTLKHYSEMIFDEIKKDNLYEKKFIIDKITDLFRKQIKEKNADNSLLIWKSNVVKVDFDTRPKHVDGDFQGFGYFNIRDFPNTKRDFQNKYIKLYYKLQKGHICKDDATKIKETISKYCNPFTMEETDRRRDTCKETFYNIMTPFYDDIEDAIDNKAENEEVKNELIASQKEIKKLISNRKMLTT